MAVTDTQAEAPAGVPVTAVPTGAPEPPSDDQRMASRAAARDTQVRSLLAEMAELDRAQAPAPAEPEKPAAAPPPAPKEEKPADEAADLDDEDDDGELTEPERPRPAEKKPEEWERRALELKRQERRTRAALAEESARRAAELESRWGPQVREAQELKAKAEERAARFLYDPLGVLEEEYGAAAGVDWESVAEAAFALTPKGKADPRYRDRVQQGARSRQATTEVSALRTELAELRKEISGRTQMEAAVRQTNAYLDRAQSAINGETPLVAQLFAADPAGVRADLHRIAVELSKQGDGEAPDHADVLAALEAEETRQLTRRGIDPKDFLARAGKQTKNKPLPAAENKPAATLSAQEVRTSSVRTPPVRAHKSRDQERADLESEVARELRDLERAAQ